MKKLQLMIAAIGVLSLSSCAKIDVDSHDQTNNYYGNSGGGSGTGTGNPVDSNLNVVVKMNGDPITDGKSYPVGPRTLLNFSWGLLPKGCEEVEISIYMYDRKTTRNLLGTGPSVITLINTPNTNYYTAEIPTHFIDYGKEALIQWTVTPNKSCSGKNTVQGNIIFQRI